MNKKDIISIIGILVSTAIGTGIAFAGSYGGIFVGSIPLFALCIIIAFAIQWIAFIPAFLLKTEKFFDLTGAFTYITVITLGAVLGMVLGNGLSIRTIIIMVLVIIWASRLGFFLFRRVLKVGEDKRFEEIKKSFFRFLMTWTIQGVWVTFTIAAGLAAATALETSPYRIYDWIFIAIGGAVWLTGFAFEAIADFQKNRFRADPNNKGKFIKSGLWSISRHPNYFGEIVIWIGMALIALPSLIDWRFVTLISPLFIALQLTRISGVNMLEKRADDKWGGQEDYEEYKKNTSVLIPWLKIKK
jgi:steroid 5-alpha reductase family enzyme